MKNLFLLCLGIPLAVSTNLKAQTFSCLGSASNNSTSYEGMAERSTCLVKDNLGNYIAIGTTKPGSFGFTDYFIAKFNNTCTNTWKTSYNGTGNANDIPVDVVTDASNNIYVTGKSSGTGSADMLTIKLNSSGSIL